MPRLKSTAAGSVAGASKIEPDKPGAEVKGRIKADKPTRLCTVCGEPIAEHARCAVCGLLLGADHYGGKAAVICQRCLADLDPEGARPKRSEPEELPEPLLTAPQVGRLLGLSPRTVRNYAASGVIPVLVVGGQGRGRRFRFRQSDLMSYLQARRRS